MDFLIFVFTFFHLFKQGACLRDDLKVQTPVSLACTDLLLLPLAEWFLHSWVICRNIVFYESHSLKCYLYFVYLFLTSQELLTLR